MTDKSRKAVPREPTPHMLEAAFDAGLRSDDEDGEELDAMTARIWRAMYDAAPVLAEPPKDGEVAALIARAYLNEKPPPHAAAEPEKPVAWYMPIGRYGNVHWGERRPDEGNLEHWRPLYASPSAQPIAREPTDEDVDEFLARAHSWQWSDRDYAYALLSARAAQPIAREPTDDELRQLVYAHFGRETKQPLLRTVWKDSIDIEEPSYALRRFVSALLAALKSAGKE